MSHLFAPGCSIFLTKRRRFFWAAWWTEAPHHVPFRKPDASNGGASTFEQAREEAQQRAGQPLVLLDPLWARAWNRILRGEEPWPSAASREPRSRKKEQNTQVETTSIWSILGVPHEVSLDELKVAYRRKVLETHPDRGGNAEELRHVLRAFKEASARLKRPKAKK